MVNDRLDDSMEKTPKDEYPHYIQPLFDKQVDYHHFPPTNSRTLIDPVEIESPGNVVREDGLDGFDKPPKELMGGVIGLNNKTKTPEEQAVYDEFHTLLLASTNQPADAIPPRPLTFSELDYFFNNVYPLHDSDYEIKVQQEPESISNTSVGRYRDRLDADVLRFRLIHGDSWVTVTFCPNKSRYGFNWYVTEPQQSESGIAQLVTDNEPKTQPLKRLLDKDVNSDTIKDVPDRLSSTAHLLDSSVTPSDPSPTPGDWVTTTCSRNSDKSELFAPRYNATLCHQPTGAVVEIKPLPADEDEFSVEELPDGTVRIGYATDWDEDDGTHEWRLSFADDLVEDVATVYPNPVMGDEIYDLLLWLDGKLDAENS